MFGVSLTKSPLVAASASRWIKVLDDAASFCQLALETVSRCEASMVTSMAGPSESENCVFVFCGSAAKLRLVIPLRSANVRVLLLPSIVPAVYREFAPLLGRAIVLCACLSCAEVNRAALTVATGSSRSAANEAATLPGLGCKQSDSLSSTQVSAPERSPSPICRCDQPDQSCIQCDRPHRSSSLQSLPVHAGLAPDCLSSVTAQGRS
jgi:hypothetical protein